MLQDQDDFIFSIIIKAQRIQYTYLPIVRNSFHLMIDS